MLKSIDTKLRTPLNEHTLIEFSSFLGKSIKKLLDDRDKSFNIEEVPYRYENISLKLIEKSKRKKTKSLDFEIKALKIIQSVGWFGYSSPLKVVYRGKLTIKKSELFFKGNVCYLEVEINVQLNIK